MIKKLALILTLMGNLMHPILSHAKTVSVSTPAMQSPHSYHKATRSYKDLYYWLKSAATFHITLGYNYITQGPCNFNEILVPNKNEPFPTVVIGKDNVIIYMTDGKQSPIYLGNIPQSQSHFAALRRHARLAPDARIGLHTLNREFEQRFVWLKTQIQQDAHITQYEYSTTDFTAPTLVDLIRGVYNLNMRDNNEEKLSYVHCKAGKGRSAALVAAYLLYIYMIAYKQNVDGFIINKIPDAKIIIESIIKYMKSLRIAVNINEKQKKVLAVFYNELITAGSLDNLYKKYESEIKVRDAEFNKV